MKNNLNTVKVIFKDSKFNYFTSVSTSATEESCKNYFVGKYFDMGIYPNENMQECIGIEFINNNPISKNGILYVKNKDYFVASARTAWDCVPVGLFGSYQDAANSFPDHAPEKFVRKATEKEILEFFNINK